jgi:hypothetical protein
MSLFDSASICVTPNGVKAGKLYSIKPTDGSGDLSVTRATTATRVNANGLIETVGANVPRLDYTNGSCPSILVEPQRTNLVLRSEEFDNGSWGKVTSTILANQIVSPDGTLSADKLQEDNSNAQHRIDQTTTSIIGTNTFSVFAKKAERNFIFLRIGTSGAHFNLTNGSISSISGVTASVEEYKDGWFRCIITRTSTVVNEIARINIIENAPITNYQGISGYGIYLWGAQLEAGSNATSYIPTVASAVTRNADVISKTGISDLIGQTEGTVLCNINLTKLSEAKTLFVIDNGTTNEYISLIRVSSNIFRVAVKNTSGAAVNIINSIVINDSICKIGIAYKNGDYAMYVNGTLRGTSTNSTNFPTTALTQFVLSNASYGTLNDSYNLVALWKTRFSNEQLATLTTI